MLFIAQNLFPRLYLVNVFPAAIVSSAQNSAPVLFAAIVWILVLWRSTHAGADAG